jgi:hypothetical protein
MASILLLVMDVAIAKSANHECKPTHQWDQSAM